MNRILYPDLARQILRDPEATGFGQAIRVVLEEIERRLEELARRVERLEER